MKEVGDCVAETEMFEVEQPPLFYSREYAINLQDPRLKRLWHSNVVEQAIYFWRKGLPYNSMIARVCNDATGDIKSSHPRWKNPMSDVPPLPQDERVFRPGSSTSGSKALFCPEQKNILWMKYIICLFTLSDSLFADSSVDTLQWLRHVCFYHCHGSLLGVTCTQSVSPKVFHNFPWFTLGKSLTKSGTLLGKKTCSELLSHESKQWRKWTWNAASRYRGRVLVFQL